MVAIVTLSTLFATSVWLLATASVWSIPVALLIPAVASGTAGIFAARPAMLDLALGSGVAVAIPVGAFVGAHIGATNLVPLVVVAWTVVSGIIAAICSISAFSVTNALQRRSRSGLS